MPSPMLKAGQAQAFAHFCWRQASSHVLLVREHEDGAAHDAGQQHAGESPLQILSSYVCVFVLLPICAVLTSSGAPMQ